MADSALVFALLAGSSVLMTGTYPAIVLLVGVVFLREPPTAPRLAALGLIAADIWLLQASGG